MKKLQNDFTTPEQSKRLLKLGVPADSANFIPYISPDSNGVEVNTGCVVSIPDGHVYSEYECGGIYPIWSVGRLIDIYEIVGEEAPKCISTKKSRKRIENLVILFEENASLLDFSELEE